MHLATLPADGPSGILWGHLWTADGPVDAHGALVRAQAASLEAEHQAIVRDVLAAGDFWGGSGSVACQEFITQLGRNFQVIYEQANSHGQKVQSAGSNMTSTDSAVGSSWA